MSLLLKTGGFFLIIKYLRAAKGYKSLVSVMPDSSVIYPELLLQSPCSE